MMKLLLIIAFLLVVSVLTSEAQQINDSLFNTTVADPAFKNQRPRVLIDAAHFNLFSTITNRIEPLTKLLEADGYLVDTASARFSKDLLSNHQIIVILTAIGASPQSDSTYFSAFTDSEIEVLYNWIKNGGSLLFGVDHSPYNYAGERLLRRLGVGISFGVIEDSVYSEGGLEKGPDARRENLVFSRENRLLGNHPILAGRDTAEAIVRVGISSGQSIKPPKGGSVLFQLSKHADNAGAGASTIYREPIGLNNASAIAFTLGNGRVVITSDCSMWTAQLVKSGDKWIEFGMARRDLNNRQFALNVMHWLSHLIN
jgi:hypothetical protein